MSEIRLMHGEAVRSMIRLRQDGVRVAAVVTDSPYELGFMGKRWDRAGVSFRPRTWRAAHCLLPEGGRLLAFAGARTAHRITCAIEDAGFVIEDSISFLLSAEPVVRALWETLDDWQREALGVVLEAVAGPSHPLLWLYGSGFPKHRSKLKPAYEPIVVARKGAVSELNIDAGRIGWQGDPPKIGTPSWGGPNKKLSQVPGGDGETVERTPPNAAGRWPANVALDEEAARALDEQSGTLTSGNVEPHHMRNASKQRNGGGYHGNFGDVPLMGYGDSGGASRFFYCAKATRAEREAGLAGLNRKPGGSTAKGFTDDVAAGQDRNRPVANHHPTVKPVDLMRWLIRMVAKPGETVLDPFMGSGTTGVAATLEGVGFIGIEREAEYLDIARLRIANTQPALGL